MVRFENGKYNVYSHSGRRFGSYATEAEANKRLATMEMFKHMKKEGADMDKEAMGPKARAATLVAGLLGAGGTGFGLGSLQKKKKVSQAERAGEFVGSIKTLEALGYGKEASEELIQKVAGLLEKVAKTLQESADEKYVPPHIGAYLGGGAGIGAAALGGLGFHKVNTLNKRMGSIGNRVMVTNAGHVIESIDPEMIPALNVLRSMRLPAAKLGLLAGGVGALVGTGAGAAGYAIAKSLARRKALIAAQKEKK